MTTMMLSVALCNFFLTVLAIRLVCVICMFNTDMHCYYIDFGRDGQTFSLVLDQHVCIFCTFQLLYCCR